MGTMLGIQSSLNGAAGALAPPLGGFLYRGGAMDGGWGKEGWVAKNGRGQA